MTFVFGGVQKHFDWHTYLATPQVHLGVYKTWSLVYLCKHSVNPLDVTNLFCLDTIECSDSWCVYTVHSKLTGYDAGNLVRAIHSCIYFSWMSAEWITVVHWISHDQEKFQSSPVVWGRHSGRWRPLSLARCSRMYEDLNPPSGKHQWYAGWLGQFANCRLRI